MSSFVLHTDPPPLAKRVRRETLLELKRLNDEYCQLVSVAAQSGRPDLLDSHDLFTQANLDPSVLFSEFASDSTGGLPQQPSRPLTIEEPSQTDFYQYGLECRYLPLHRYLQVAKKAVLTDDWRAAREELVFSRAFDRLLELRSSKSLSMVIPRRPASPTRARGQWDGILEAARWMWLDIQGEREWKRRAAKALAEEAVAFIKLKSVDSKPLFYFNDLLNHLDRETAVYEGIGHDIRPKDVQEHLAKTHRQWIALDEGNDENAVENNTEEHTIPPQDAEMEADASNNWRVVDDKFIRDSFRQHGNVNIIADALERTPQAIMKRWKYLHEQPIEDQDARLQQIAAKHMSTSTAMQSAACKLITVRAVLSPPAAGRKLTTALSQIHPSHEAAVRKANQNVMNRLMTPGELALRRLQRSRGSATVHSGQTVGSMTGSPLPSQLVQSLPSQAVQSGVSTPKLQN